MKNTNTENTQLKIVTLPFQFKKTSSTLNKEIVDYLIDNKDYHSLSQLPNEIYSNIISSYAQRKIKDTIIEVYNNSVPNNYKNSNSQKKLWEESADIIKNLNFQNHWDFCKKNLVTHELNSLVNNVYKLGILNYNFLDTNITLKNPIIYFLSTLYQDFKPHIDNQIKDKTVKYSTSNDLFIHDKSTNLFTRDENSISLELAHERLQIIARLQTSQPINNIIKPNNINTQLFFFEKDKKIFKKILETHQPHFAQLIHKYNNKTTDEKEYQTIHNTIGVIFNKLSYNEIENLNSPYHIPNFFKMTFKEILFKAMKYNADETYKKLEYYINEVKHEKLNWGQLNFEPAVHQYPLDRLISLSILSNNHHLMDFFFDKNWITDRTKTQLSESDCQKTFSQDIIKVFGKTPTMPILITSCIINGIDHPITERILTIPNTKENSLREISGRLKKRTSNEFPFLEKLLLSLEHYDILKNKQSKKIKL